MSFAKHFNKGVKRFTFNTEGLNYISLKELLDRDGDGVIYTVRGCHINRKSKFGASPVVYIEDNLVNLPSHELETVEEILASDVWVKDIEDGKVGFVIEEYTSKNYGTKCFGVNWVDIEVV